MSIQGRIFAISALAIAVAGCSSATLTEGTSLAKAGQTAASQMEQNATVSANLLNTLKEAVAFDDGYNEQVGNPASRTFLVNISAIQNRLAQYAQMLESLSASYSALGDLASYDASGTFNTSISTLSSDANKFLKSVGSGVQIPQDVGGAIKEIGGFAIGSIQASQVEEASEKIETVLKQVIPILKDSKTRELLVLNAQEVTAQINQAAVTAYATGAYSYDSVLDQIGAPLGLKSNSGSDAIVAKNTKLKAGLLNVEIELTNEQATSAGASYDKSVAALEALIPLHESLNNGVPLNFGTLTTIVGELQNAATSLQPTKGK